MGLREVRKRDLKAVKGLVVGASAKTIEPGQVPRDLLRLVAMPMTDNARRLPDQMGIALPQTISSKAEMPDGLITAAQLSRYLQLPVAWCWRAARRGLIPHYRCGQYIRFDLPEILECIKRSQREEK